MSTPPEIITWTRLILEAKLGDDPQFCCALSTAKANFVTVLQRDQFDFLFRPILSAYSFVAMLQLFYKCFWIPLVFQNLARGHFAMCCVLPNSL